MVAGSVKLRARHRRLAAVGGFLLLVAQLLAVAHFHRNQFATGISATPQATSNGAELCPICVSTLHAPVAVAFAPSVARPHAAIERAVDQQARPSSSPVLTLAHGRAPPVSV